MARAKKPLPTLDGLLFVTPEQKLLRFLISEPTTAFTPRTLSSKLKGVRGLGGSEGLATILGQLEELGLLLTLNNHKEVCLQNDHPMVKYLKIVIAMSDVEGLGHLLMPISTRGVLMGSKANGTATSESHFEMCVVSETPEEVSKVVQRYPLGRQIELHALTPRQYEELSKKNPTLSAQVDQGILLWGSLW